MNMILPQSKYLEGLRKLCDQYGVVLIFDEVMTGFVLPRAVHKRWSTFGRTSPASVKSSVVECQLVRLGAPRHHGYAGPLGPVYQAGTLSGNPVAMAADCHLSELSQPGFYDALNATTDHFVTGMISRRRCWCRYARGQSRRHVRVIFADQPVTFICRCHRL